MSPFCVNARVLPNRPLEKTSNLGSLPRDNQEDGVIVEARYPSNKAPTSMLNK